VNTPRIIVALFAAFIFVLCAPVNAKKQELPEVTEDGLHLVPDSRLAIVYAEPGATLAGYRRVKLLDAYVAFKKNWERDQRSQSTSRLTSDDIEKIKEGLAREFAVVFTQVLEDGGYPVVDEVADDVLLLRPAIINLDVAAPDSARAGNTRSFVPSAGEMTLYLEAYDSVTSDLIAKAMDRKADRRNDGYYTWANTVTNKVAADRILRGWATILLDALNEATQSGAAVAGEAENES
jgi:hypothetical protein